MKYKIRYTTVLLTGIFCMIPIVCTLMFHHLNLTETLTRMGSGGFGLSNTLIRVYGTITTEDLLQTVDALPSCVAIYVDEEREEGTIRYIYYNDGYVYLPLKSGRFFKASDFFEDSPVAVVGKNREKDCFVDATGNPFIMVDNQEYNVIGVLGYEQATVLDDMIYLNMNALKILESPMLFLDCLGEESYDRISGQLIYKLQEKSVPAEQMAGSMSFSDSVMPKIVTARWFLGILACCFICLLLVSIQWLHSQRQEVIVRMLVGASAVDIAWFISKKYLGLAFLSLIAGGLYCFTVFPAYMENLLMGYGLSMGIIFAFLVMSLHYLLRLNIQEGLK